MTPVFSILSLLSIIILLAIHPSSLSGLQVIEGNFLLLTLGGDQRNSPASTRPQSLLEAKSWSKFNPIRLLKQVEEASRLQSLVSSMSIQPEQVW